MPGEIKRLKFSDGVTVTAPTTSFFQAGSFAVYASTGDYITAKGEAAADGDSFYNSTDDQVYYYSNGAWSQFVDNDSSQTMTNKQMTTPQFNEAVNMTATSTELNQLDGVTVGGTNPTDIITVNGSQELLNKAITNPTINGGATLGATSTELNQLDGVTVGGTLSGDIVDLDTAQSLTNKDLTGVGNSLNADDLSTGTVPDARVASSSVTQHEANITITNLSGTLDIAGGGTGQTTATNAFDALAPTTTKGDLIIHNGTDNIRLGVGADGTVLTANSGEVSGFGFTAPLTNPMDSDGDLIVGGVSGAATKLDSGAANSILQANGAAAPSWVSTVTLDSATLSSASPKLTLTDTTTGADNEIDGDNATGSLVIGADANNEVASSTIDLQLDGGSEFKVTTSGVEFYAGQGNPIADITTQTGNRGILALNNNSGTALSSFRPTEGSGGTIIKNEQGNKVTVSAGSSATVKAGDARRGLFVLVGESGSGSLVVGFYSGGITNGISILHSDIQGASPVIVVGTPSATQVGLTFSGGTDTMTITSGASVTSNSYHVIYMGAGA